MRKTLFTGLGAAGALSLPWLSGCAAEAASVGIIGGADGPTSIIVSGSMARPFLIAGLILLFLAVVLYRLRKTRPGREEEAGKKPPGAL